MKIQQEGTIRDKYRCFLIFNIKKLLNYKKHHQVFEFSDHRDSSNTWLCILIFEKNYKKN